MKIAGQLTVDDFARVCPLLCRQTNPRYGEDRTRAVEVQGGRFGNGRPVVIGGPCAVESHDQTLAVARAVKRAGADMLRGAGQVVGRVGKSQALEAHVLDELAVGRVALQNDELVQHRGDRGKVREAGLVGR